jgi:peroxin-6
MTSIASQTETKLLQIINKSITCQPSIICLRDFELFGLNNEGHEDVRLVDFFREEIDKLFSKQEFENPIFIIALINAKQPSKSIRLNHLFLESIEIAAPDKSERFRDLLWLHQRERFDRRCWRIKNKNLENYISVRMDDGLGSDLKILQKMADLTQGFIFGDLAFLYEKGVGSGPDNEEFTLSEDLFDEKLAEMKKLFGESIGTPDIPKVLWEDIGGLAKLKTEIQNSIGLPLKFSHLMGKHMKRSGILLYGPPGIYCNLLDSPLFILIYL